MVQIDPRGWLTKELDFEKTETELSFQLEHAGCVLGRRNPPPGTREDGQRRETKQSSRRSGRRLEAARKAIPASREIISSAHGTGARKLSPPPCSKPLAANDERARSASPQLDGAGRSSA